MRRMAACLTVLMLLFSGCSLLRESTYVAVSPHDEDYSISQDTNAMTVTSYLSLKNALLGMVQDGMDTGEIRAESYSGDLPEDLSQVVYEVTQLNPLGAYAVSSISYDYSRIVNRYEVHVSISFKKTPVEIENVRYANDNEGVRTLIQGAMESYESQLVLRVGDYDPMDISAEVAEIYLSHPEYALELPDVTMELYPESGSSRILDIHFVYLHTPEELSQAREDLREAVRNWVVLYADSGNVLTNLRMLYNRIGRAAVLEQVQEDRHSFTNSAYGALLEGRATSYGFAQGYLLLMREIGVPCSLIAGQRGGSAHSWCQIQMEDALFYADPSRAVQGPSQWFFLMDSDDLDAEGYDQWNAGDYPRSQLPLILKPRPFR